jgi:hypothetical protein
MTTIKVPREVRDRLAEVARAQHVTLATALVHALDRAEELDFWTAVREHHAQSSDTGDHLADVALRDDLADESDDRLGRSGW